MFGFFIAFYLTVFTQLLPQPACFHHMKNIFSTLLLLLLQGPIFSQKNQWWGASNYGGSIVAHTEDVENTRGAKPTGLFAFYQWQRLDSNQFKKFNGLPTQQVSFAWHQFGTPVLGKSASVQYHVLPEISFSRHAGIQFDIAGGLAWLSNPHHPIKNPNNNSYSTPIAAYLQVGVQPYVRLGNYVQLFAGAKFQHISNAGVELPNKGINWFTTHVGLQVSTAPYIHKQPFVKQYKNKVFTPYSYKTVTALAALRSNEVDATVKYGIAGVAFLYTKVFKPTHGYTLGSEILVDGSIQNPLLASVLAGHVFIWGKYLFSQQVGIYVHPQTAYDAWYHRWGIEYRVSKSWQVGISLKAHRQVANFPDIRVAYRW
ncbi:MAG: acyloxyacyl hydrolase [Bacteroidetes bacterium]|nr:MAG: acyloxyacyl hydrolase [Bacteroidota bacterium]TAE72882.1 MAG: acyloxyacyl hydrolase [Bacteroidota bacterium]TAF94022.1 MAG: acyloxyacyl hydrolase [Bacteroidota bacterium]